MFLFHVYFCEETHYTSYPHFSFQSTTIWLSLLTSLETITVWETMGASGPIYKAPLALTSLLPKGLPEVKATYLHAQRSSHEFIISPNEDEINLFSFSSCFFFLPFSKMTRNLCHGLQLAMVRKVWTVFFWVVLLDSVK